MHMWGNALGCLVVASLTVINDNATAGSATTTSLSYRT